MTRTFDQFSGMHVQRGTLVKRFIFKLERTQLAQIVFSMATVIYAPEFKTLRANLDVIS